MSEVPFQRHLAVLTVVILAGAAWHNVRAWRRWVSTSTAAAQRTRPLVAGATCRPKVSVLVAAWKEDATVRRHIASFQSLTYPAKELVLCAGGGDTYRLAVEAAGPDVIVIRQHAGEGKQRALSRCLQVSSGEILVLSDADCVLNDVAFRSLIGPLVQRDADVATGFRRPLDEQCESWFVRFQWLSEAASAKRRLHADGLWGGNCAIRRELADRLGIFDEPARTGTDYVQGRLVLRAGYPIRWIGPSLVETRYPADASRYLSTWRRWIKNILIHGPRFRDWRGIRETLIAIGLAAVTLLSPLTWPLLGRASVWLPLTSLAVATMNRIRRVAVGAHATASRPAWTLFAAAPLFAILDQVATLLAAVDLLSLRGRTRW